MATTTAWLLNEGGSAWNRRALSRTSERLADIVQAEAKRASWAPNPKIGQYVGRRQRTPAGDGGSG
jgi:hypothetical protein